MAGEELRTVGWDIDEMVMCSNNNNVFGTPFTVLGTVKATLEVRVKSGEQMGDGGIYSVVSKMIGGTATIQFADMQGFGVVSTLTGMDQESSDDDTLVTLPFTQKPFPFFSFAAKTFLDDGIGNFVIWVPKAKVMQNFTYSIADNEFSIPEFQATVIPSHVTRNSRKVIAFPLRYDADTPLTIPPYGLALS